MGRDNRAYLGGPITLVLLLLLSGWVGMLIPEATELESQQFRLVGARGSGGDVDVPSWRVNDLWTYDGYMDVATLLANNGISSNIQTLTGDLDMWVEDILFMTVENQSTLVYKVRSHALFEANGVNLDGNSGDLDVDYDQTDFVRVSDLATVEMTMDIDVTFTVWIGPFPINEDVGQMIITNGYSPPREQYDFPLRVGETWTNNYTNTLTWAGESDYFTIPDDSVNQGSSGHAVVAYGDPGVPYGTGCAGSYNVTSYDSNGTPDGFQWWCPSVSNDAWRHIEIELGLEIDFKLKSITPVQRSTNIDVDLEYPAWPLDTNLSAWVNVSSSSGSPLGSQTLEFRYECVGYSTSLTTAANGSAFVRFDTGHATDPSPTLDDYASHGVIAWMASSKKVGVDTITLDDQLLTIDYTPRAQGVSIERTRGDMVHILNPSVGFNAIPGDSLMFSIPVQNLGILPGPTTELEVIAPDGTTSRASVPSLHGLQEVVIQATWNVPPSQPVGDVTIRFHVDPDGLMVEDQNQSNNVATFTLFIGRLPIAEVVHPPPTRTLAEVVLDARGSIDPDGGSPVCTFVVQGNGSINETFTEESCLMSYIWDDDGVYLVWLTVTDDENDQDHTHISITILNRAPWVNITSPVTSIPVETEIRFDAFDHGDLDTRNPSAPVSIIWDKECEKETRVTLTCTVTPMEEGIYVISLTAEDDDGTITSAEYNLIVSNIAPSDVTITASLGDEELVANSQMRWPVLEDQLVTLHGTAYDSINDRNSLTWGWQPDLDVDPNLFFQTTGANSSIDHHWSESGTHVIAMEVVDDDGATSGVVNAWVTVANVPPTVENITRPFPVGEDMDVTLTGKYSDTESDLEDLRVCWDVDFGVDLDENGDNMDDCDVTGDDFRWAWSKKGIHTVRFHVTDDDGVQNSTLVDVEVVNKKPVAHAEAELLTIMVGQELTIWTNNTTDSESDMAILIYTWDLDYFHDADDDGDHANDLDYEGTPFRRSFDTPGTKYIRLTVSDEIYSDTFDLEIVVLEDDSGALGWLEGSGVSLPVAALALVFVALLMVLAFTMLRRPSSHSDDEWMEVIGDVMMREQQSTMAPPAYAPGEAGVAHQAELLTPPAQDAYPPVEAAAPPAYDPTAQPEAMDLLGGEAQAPPAHIESPVSTGPPQIPADGLPPGWTHEQWNHYGKEWLEQQSQEQAGHDTGLDLDL
jgi:hypothetical protein